MTKKNKLLQINKGKDCLSLMLAVRDTLDVLGGKWKILILISLMHGNRRFTEIERSIPKISSKVLAKELKELEQNMLITRTVHDESHLSVEYTITDYARSLENVMYELYDWGSNHRKKIFGK